MESTFFAPAGRAEEHLLMQQHQSISQVKFMTAVLHSVSDMMLILNEHRQIVAVNKKLLDTFNVADPLALIGMRPGESVSCIHSSQGPDGCGTAESCSACGAVLTILASQESVEQTEGECRLVISANGGTALDLEVKATPLEADGQLYTIFAIKDIGSDKRRQVLERTFFHDILNTVGGINGIANMLVDSDGITPEIEAEYKEIMVDLSDNLAEEINQQRRLLAAERGEYVPEMKNIELRQLLQDVCTLYGNHTRAPDRSVILDNFPECHLTTDQPMLRRIVGNMVLNALEATPVGGTVRVALVSVAGSICIEVANLGEIPKEVQLSLFKRSFSTKASSGRGIGTYSMKLFGEKYLGGEVNFRCINGETVFFIKFIR
jgi:nitrogen fixation/metabolism regulation signal transduction histidine kinase